MILTDELVEKAVEAFWDFDGGVPVSIRAALSAVLPDVIAAERERAAKVAENWHVLRDGDMTIAKLAAAIRKGD